MTAKRRTAPARKARGRTPSGAAPEQPPSDPALIVAVGASAGGLEAFTELLRALPRDSGLAYVLVQHLDPAHESLLAELLGRVAPFPVAEATDGMAVVANHGYVIPPAATMVLADGQLRLGPREKSRQPARPIDTFFRSLADEAGSRAIGVVLSGVASDGASGLEAIKAAGGITFAQDPASARFDGMPVAAIATGCTDFVLPPAEIAARLAYIGQHPFVRLPEAAATDVDPLAAVLEVLRRHCGINFALYKDGTIRRRLLRRMVMRGIDGLLAYLALLRSDAAEVDALCADLLIGVTRFFRDPGAFAALSETAFPELLKHRTPGEPLRIWVPGCATGEEPYSIAMCLLEFLAERRESVSIQIFATDLNDGAITSARTGRYPSRIEHDVSPARLREFFVKEENGYRIARSVRDLCVFARQNVTDDPPFSQLDMVSCRNLLIYLRPSAHPRVFAIFHYALKQGGVLVLGNSESVALAPTLFRPIQGKHRIYARIGGTIRPPILDLVAAAANRPRALSYGPAEDYPRESGATQVQRAADELVLGSYAPAGVVVDDALQVVQFRGRTAAFLAPASGTASLDLLRMVRPATQALLRKALRTARTQQAPVYVKGVRARGAHDRRRATSLRVIPFTMGAPGTQYFVVLFEDSTMSPAATKAPTEAPIEAPAQRRRAGQSLTGPGKPRTVSELRQELDAMRGSLQAVAAERQGFVEELQIASEEAQSSGEEFQSANEELQSTNEELETAKEELQSTNEELTTVNEELRTRMSELVRLNDDLNNVLGIIHVPLIIVDRDLLIRRFTAGAERLMNLIPSDVGRPIGNIRSNKDVPDLEQIIASVMRTLKPEEREVRDTDGRWFSVTIRPYATAERAIDGAVIIYQDIDIRHRHVVELDAARLSADVANRAKSLFLTTMSHELRTPLNAIAGYAALMADGIRGPVTAEQTRDLSRIRDAGMHLMGLINDILNYAKLESSQVRFAVESIPLGEMLAAAVAMVAPQAQAKAIGLEYLPSDPLATARGDREKAMQIVLNLLSNAVKFTRTGGRIILASDPTGDPVRVWVSDTGRGIAAPQLERVFEPFVQVGRGLSGPEAGVGLGLSISRDLARAMEGDLTVDSVEGVGSTFVLTLPRGAPMTEPARPPLATSVLGDGVD